MSDLIATESNLPVSTNEDHLSKVVHKALKQIEAILDEEMPTKTDPNYTKLLSVKKDAASSIINAGLKADENRFRRENKDIIERLFDKVKKESRIVDGQVIHKV